MRGEQLNSKGGGVQGKVMFIAQILMYLNYLTFRYRYLVMCSVNNGIVYKEKKIDNKLCLYYSKTCDSINPSALPPQ